MYPLSAIERLRKTVEAETGMDLSGTRFPRLQAALKKTLSSSSEADLDRILAHAEEHTALLENLTAELTVGESFFFRNEHHIRALRDHVLPEILRENVAQRKVRIWSAGCATGEEPYSLAILLDQLLTERGRWETSILGTDLNLGFLERARQARYRNWSFRLTDIHEDRRYFSLEDEWYVLAPRVREHVRFAYLNLVKDVYPSAMTGTLGLDLILFRNVAIYLKPEVTKAIIERFLRALRPGGWLLLGEVELSMSHTAGLEPCHFDQATFFRKPAGMPEVPQSPLPLIAPLLGAAVSSGSTSIPGVPTLPKWGPLPWASNSSQPAQPSLPQTTANHTAWDTIEQHLRLQNFAEAERLLDRIVPVKERAKNRLHYIQLLLEKAQIARARQMLDVCLVEEPLMVAAQLLRAGFAEEMGDLIAAEQACRSALYIDRHCPMAHFHLALVLQQKGDRAGTSRSLQTTLQLIQDKNAQDLVLYGEGICYGRLREMATLILSLPKTTNAKE